MNLGEYANLVHDTKTQMDETGKDFTWVFILAATQTKIALSFDFISLLRCSVQQSPVFEDLFLMLRSEDILLMGILLIQCLPSFQKLFCLGWQRGLRYRAEDILYVFAEPGLSATLLRFHSYHDNHGVVQYYVCPDIFISRTCSKLDRAGNEGIFNSVMV